MYQRLFDFNMPPGQSAFFWGPRQSGKSSYLRTMFPRSAYFDLLEGGLALRLMKDPGLLREEIQALPESVQKRPIIIDEFQKNPSLLNDVHWLIENAKMQFILCGSSARQLKTPSTNLLGGRAWVRHFFPLVSAEIPDFELLRAMNHGLLPKHYDSAPDYITDHFSAYISAYLEEEVRNEGLTRNLAGFARFLDAVGLCNGQMLNYSNIARDCGINRATVQGYFEILSDTLLGVELYPYSKKIKRDLIRAMPKFYLFDVGIANYLAGHTITHLAGPTAGAALEHLILMELRAFLAYRNRREKIAYWRTKTGHEVDFVLGDARVAIEVKISAQVLARDVKGLAAFCEEHPQVKPFVVSMDKAPRMLKLGESTSVSVLPVHEFLRRMWNDEII